MNISDHANGLLEQTTALSAAEENLAYIRCIASARGVGYGVYLSDGTELAIFPSFNAAFYTARQHDLEPVQVH